MVEQRITTVDQLVGLIGVPLPRVADKVRRSLHELDREWLAASPFCLVATSDDTGACDVSPKGDPPGHLAYVIDDTTTPWPNGRETAAPTDTRTFCRTRMSV
jgi:predicted pyridoxine 5'-phosphate oxidase superfamily flavin-nucleotide-binding protein